MTASLVLVLALVPLTAIGQGFPATPPPDLAARPYNVPKTETTTLPNGLKVIVAENHRVPLVTMRMAIQAGTVLNPKDNAAVADAVASQISAGTDKYTSLQLQEAAENLGGSVRVSAGDDFATVSASALSENLAAITDLMADVLLHPTFPESELSVYKGLTLQGLVAQRQNPGFLAGEQMAKALYDGHPYGIVAPSSEAVQGLTRDKLLAFYRAHYTPKGAVLIVVGDVKPAAVFDAVRRTLSRWSGPNAESASAPPEVASDTRRVFLVDRPGSVQSNLELGNRAIKRTDPDYCPLVVANTILGGGGTSRLYLDVREEKGFAYDVHSSLSPRKLAGSFTEGAQVRTDVTAPAIKAMLDDSEQIRTQPVTADELRAAKNYINGRFVLGLVTQSGLADALLTQQVYGLPADYLASYRGRISAVSTQDVQGAAQRNIRPDRFAVVVVGNASKIGDSLKTFGPVENAK